MTKTLQQIADKSYRQFMDDESIVGFEGILMSRGIRSGRKKNQIRKLIYDKYGKDNLQHIYRQRLAKSSHKNRTAEDYYISPEQRQKMVEGIKRSWKNADIRRKCNAELMKKYCHPKAWSLETNKKRVLSRKGYRHTADTVEKIRVALKGRPLSKSHRKALCVPKSHPGSLGLKRSAATKQKLSQITLLQWKTGVHVPTYRSKGQREVASMFRNDGYAVKEEFFINGRPYDVFVKERNLLIEFNGTFWHRDPRFYSQSGACQKVWDNDKTKMELAKQNGYNIAVIWQYDWERSQDKPQLLESIINGTY